MTGEPDRGPRRPDPGSPGRDDPRDAGDTDSGPLAGEESPACELCGGPVVERHCKIVCLNCGYQRDCSDP